MADDGWRALELCSHSQSSSHCSSHSLSSMGDEAHGMPMPAPKVSFCSTLDAPPSESPPGSLDTTRAKGALKAPRYKACQVQIQENLELSGTISTMSMDLSLSVHSSDGDNEREEEDWEEASYGSNGSDDDYDRSVMTASGDDIRWPCRHDKRAQRLLRPCVQLRKKKGFRGGWKALMRAFPSDMTKMWRIRRHNKDKDKDKDKDCKDKGKDKDKYKRRRGEDGRYEYPPLFALAGM